MSNYKPIDCNHKLAIVIPAYKITFFEQAIHSISEQTCKDFTLYIGDDASPHDFSGIVNTYNDRINIVYRKFEENLGSTNLVEHWNRCVDMTQNEEWIWLFSDDDLMDQNCVDYFYKHIKENTLHNLLHFDIHIINEENVKIYKITKFLSPLSTMDFFTQRLTSKLKSCVVEYIFRRKFFEQVNRFESFDLAWGSDDATWLKLSMYNGINTISGAYVKWRQSTLNISPMSDSNTILRKVNATISYVNWAKDFFSQNNINDLSTDMEKATYPIRVITSTSSLNYLEKYKLVLSIVKSLDLEKIKSKVILRWVFLELKENVKHLIRYDYLLKKKAKFNYFGNN